MACAGEDHCVLALTLQHLPGPWRFSRPQPVQVVASQGQAGPGCVGPGADDPTGWMPWTILHKEETCPCIARLPRAGRGCREEEWSGGTTATPR